MSALSPHQNQVVPAGWHDLLVIRLLVRRSCDGYEGSGAGLANAQSQKTRDRGHIRAVPRVYKCWVDRSGQLFPALYCFLRGNIAAQNVKVQGLLERIRGEAQRVFLIIRCFCIGCFFFFSFSRQQLSLAHREVI